jgi:hypothetical protein
MSQITDGPVAQPAMDDLTPAYRRSLRASRARRAAAVRRTRRIARGRRSLAATVLAMSALTGGAFAAPTAPATRSSSQSSATIAAAQRALGIAADGIAGPQTRKAVRRFQRTKGLQVDGIIGPLTLAALGVNASAVPARDAAPAPARDAARSAGASSLLEAIALCESGGDPTLVSPSGHYRGKYQFTRSTWRSVGGTGDPAAALESEQDARATKLMARQGPSAWPACSRRVGAAA